MCNYSLTGVDDSSITDTQLLDNGEDGINIVYTISANIKYASFEISNAAGSNMIIFSKIYMYMYILCLLCERIKGTASVHDKITDRLHKGCSAASMYI